MKFTKISRIIFLICLNISSISPVCYGDQCPEGLNVNTLTPVQNLNTYTYDRNTNLPSQIFLGSYVFTSTGFNSDINNSPIIDQRNGNYYKPISNVNLRLKTVCQIH